MTDIDALIADARNRGDALRTLFPNDGEIRDDARLYETLADALESTLAELRQERERAEFYKREVDVADSTPKLARQRADKAEAELARAQAVIEKASEAILRMEVLEAGVTYGVRLKFGEVEKVQQILAAYEKGQQS